MNQEKQVLASLYYCGKCERTASHLAAGASTKREKTPQMIMRLVREKVQKNTAFKESTLAPTPELLAGEYTYIDRLQRIVYGNGYAGLSTSLSYYI